jgi:hypothetical protein
LRADGTLSVAGYVPDHHPISLDQLKCPVAASTEQLGSLGELGSLSLRSPLPLQGGTHSGVGVRVRLDGVDWAVARRAVYALRTLHSQNKQRVDNETVAHGPDLTLTVRHSLRLRCFLYLNIFAI